MEIEEKGKRIQKRQPNEKQRKRAKLKVTRNSHLGKSKAHKIVNSRMQKGSQGLISRAKK